MSQGQFRPKALVNVKWNSRNLSRKLSQKSPILTVKMYRLGGWKFSPFLEFTERQKRRHKLGKNVGNVACLSSFFAQVGLGPAGMGKRTLQALEDDFSWVGN